jgi:hypothetical protein
MGRDSDSIFRDTPDADSAPIEPAELVRLTFQYDRVVVW